MSKKYTKEELIPIVKERNIEFIGDYMGAREHTMVRCMICGHEWGANISSIINKGTGCSKCRDNQMSKDRKLSDEEAKRKVFEKTNGLVELVGTYDGRHKESLFLCHRCGNTFYDEYGKVMNRKNDGCKECLSKIKGSPVKYTTEQARNMVLEHSNGTIHLIGEYKGWNSKADFVCDCGYSWSAVFGSVMGNNGKCPNCNHSRYYTREETEADIFAVHQGRIRMIGEYVNRSVHTLFQCTECGRIYSATPQNVIRGYGCDICNRKASAQRKIEDNADKYIIKVQEKHNGKVFFLEDYKGSKVSTKFGCIEGHVWYNTPDNVSRQNGCPICDKSLGENAICSWLKEHSVEYIPQKRFKGLTGVNDGSLSYDFYIPSINMCIEYQGEQHYRPIKFHEDNDADAQFINQQEHDRRKRQYCIDNGITLLEIPYTDYDRIEEILEKALKS